MKDQVASEKEVNLNTTVIAAEIPKPSQNEAHLKEDLKEVLKQ